MKQLTKTDRGILIGSIGILLISTGAAFSKILHQELEKEQIKNVQAKALITETINIKQWRRQHEEQMLLKHKILKELNCRSRTASY